MVLFMYSKASKRHPLGGAGCYLVFSRCFHPFLNAFLGACGVWVEAVAEAKGFKTSYEPLGVVVMGGFQTLFHSFSF